MRALQLDRYDGPTGLRLSDIPAPVPEGDQLLVDVRAIGVNYPDLLMTQGGYQLKPELPFVPGCELAGVVEKAPEGSEWSVGDRIAAFVWSGSYADKALVPTAAAMPLADEIDFVSGAGMVVNYQTVHFALARRGGLRREESVLVLGATGGIGSAAVQVAKGLGARVIAGVASAEDHAFARELGADDVVTLDRDFAAGVRGLTGGRGVDVVLDPLGDWLFVEATRALAPEGRLLVVGFAAGQIPTIAANRLLLKNISAVGVAWGAFLETEPTIVRTAGQELVRMYKEGFVKPMVAREFEFHELPSALAQLSAGAIKGKAVVKIS